MIYVVRASACATWRSKSAETANPHEPPRSDTPQSKPRVEPTASIVLGRHASS